MCLRDYLLKNSHEKIKLFKNSYFSQKCKIKTKLLTVGNHVLMNGKIILQVKSF